MIHYQITPANPHGHLFDVTMTISHPAHEQQLWLPAWLPGSYMVRDFAKNLIDIKAFNSQGMPLPLTQLDKQNWQISHCDDTVRITYQVYAWDLSVRTAFLDARRGFFNGSSVFLAARGLEQSEHSVEILPPSLPACSEWEVATRLKRASGNDWGFGRFYAENYDELIDHPVEMGCFTRGSFEACGVSHDVILAGRHHADMPRLCRDLQTICEYQIQLFGTPAPFERYLFMTAVLDEGFGGLEHRASTALMCGRGDLPRVGQDNIDRGYRTYLSLCCHEYFHSWNVKRIKPARFVPYELEAESYTRQLWAYEGITSYYDDFITYRAGLVDETSYLEMLSETFTRVYRGAGRFKQSLTDSSFNAWTKFYQQDENAANAIVSYYTKGALFALLLDLTLRQETQGRYSLDDVMRRLWQEFGLTGTGTTDNSHQQIVSTLLGRNCDELFAWLERAEDMPLAELLAQFGINMQLRASSGNTDTGGTAEGLTVGFGAKYRAENVGVKIISVAEHSPAMTAGLSAGDLLIAADGLQATATLDKFLQQYQLGEQIELVWLRRDELMLGMLPITAAKADTVMLSITDADKAANWLKR
ncbi:peptidase M61 [Shewanella sp. NFH-SH190041]|uniref:M61 family metallopeptidase n=1 Tax=Shewanella sp. NFH-SH190041 TaxID=2950245 RepID=UPI0021C3CA1E|nr:PDZ domain-containing protein [Shewanella sp. NFH-SH190041]BDM64765.1 peptidase M61 [Shewanella sp. NFH-SH190041]